MDWLLFDAMGGGALIVLLLAAILIIVGIVALVTD